MMKQKGLLPVMCSFLLTPGVVAAVMSPILLGQPGYADSATPRCHVVDIDEVGYLSLDDIKTAKQQGVDNQARFKELKGRMIAQGEARKRQIIEQAKQQSVVMLEETRRKMENRIVQAKASLKMELLDMAIEQAQAKLPGIMTDGDNQRLLDDYMQHIHT